MKGQNKLFIAIIIALVVGIILGGIIHFYAAESTIDSFASKINLLGTLFIRLVQMIIAPLVFTTLVVGIGKMGDMKMVGRVGGKAMAWFISASLISLLIGMFWVNVLAPGEGTEIAMNISDAGELLQGHEELNLNAFLNHVVPRSIFEAFAQNEILQIVVFSIFFGLALAAYGEKRTNRNGISRSHRPHCFNYGQLRDVDCPPRGIGSRCRSDRSIWF